MTTGIGGDILVSDEILDWITYSENYAEFECEACHRSLAAITPGATLRTIIRAAELHMAVCDDEQMTDIYVETLSLVMARSEGNEEAQQRAILNNYDALGYTALAKAAVDELQRLGQLPRPTTTDAPAGSVGAP